MNQGVPAYQSCPIESRLMLIFFVLLSIGTLPGYAQECDSGWAKLERKSGDWCVKVFSQNLNQVEAEAKCATLSATLSGIETAEEKDVIAELGRIEMIKTTSKHGTLRVGGERCSMSAPFYWLDRRTTGNKGFIWATGEPITEGTYGSPPLCAMMYLWVTGGETTTRKHGELFSRACTTIGADRYRGYVCGKNAK